MAWNENVVFGCMLAGSQERQHRYERVKEIAIQRWRGRNSCHYLRRSVKRHAASRCCDEFPTQRGIGKRGKCTGGRNTKNDYKRGERIAGFGKPRCDDSVHAVCQQGAKQRRHRGEARYIWTPK